MQQRRIQCIHEIMMFNAFILSVLALLTGGSIYFMLAMILIGSVVTDGLQRETRHAFATLWTKLRTSSPRAAAQPPVVQPVAGSAEFEAPRTLLWN